VQNLCAASKFKCIEPGAAFRSFPADSKVAKLIAAGSLAPDENLFELLTAEIGGGDDILIDGFPRALTQARWLVENYAGLFDIKILYLNVAPAVMLKRIRGRVEDCGRADDADAAAVRRRLDIFQRMTVPAIEWLRNNKLLEFSEIDAAGTIQEVMRRVNAAISDKTLGGVA
jgi:adenylate kinase